jgi:hypothetical protein
MMNALLMSLFDYILWLFVNTGLLASSIAHTLKKNIYINAITLLEHEFGMIWVTFACICEISLQIDSISVLCEVDGILR